MRKEQYSHSYFHQSLGVVGQSKRGKPYFHEITAFNTANLEPKEFDFYFLREQLNNYLESADKGMDWSEYNNVEENIEIVKGKKFLIPKELIKIKKIEDIDENYEYPHDLVSWDEMASAVLQNKDIDNVLYGQVVFNYGRGFYVWVIVDASTNKIVSQNSFGGIKMGRDFVLADFEINPKSFKYAWSKIAQKVNTRQSTL